MNSSTTAEGVGKDATEALSVLQSAPAFGQLRANRLKQIAERCTVRRLTRGESLWSRGEPSDAVLVVASGRLKCWIGRDGDREWVLDVLRPAGTCGLSGAAGADERFCSCVALERSRVVLVPMAVARELMDSDAAFASAVAAALASELQDRNNFCAELVLRSPLERLARYLLDRVDASGAARLTETQSQIAAQLGTVREVVGRALRRLESDSVVHRDGRTIYVLKPDALRRLAE